MASARTPGSSTCCGASDSYPQRQLVQRVRDRTEAMPCARLR